MRVIKNTLITEEVSTTYDFDNETGSTFLLFNHHKFGLLTATGHSMLPVEFKVFDYQLMINALINLKNTDLSDTCVSITNDNFYFDEELLITIKNNCITIMDDDLIAFFWCNVSSLFIETTKE